MLVEHVEPKYTFNHTCTEVHDDIVVYVGVYVCEYK